MIKFYMCTTYGGQDFLYYVYNGKLWCCSGYGDDWEESAWSVEEFRGVAKDLFVYIGSL